MPRRCRRNQTVSSSSAPSRIQRYRARGWIIDPAGRAGTRRYARASATTARGTGREGAERRESMTRLLANLDPRLDPN